ncbi:FG-GAP-like repeat-containing protein [Rhodopirellula sp. MGV]|uniref:FG-GAP-like repeat-containing protein n=1 Tax=Rhodopirellula sp. MGV TaxID=2023130 RepID=UPI000B96D414|nr:FG-GAP-like repeat-containing protein [Rhodopirellula sp. MGV]OYP37966.1 hypothetical protein CGZ80_03845 [Rhodopirellula sp. MGV]PNY34268.1 RNA-binding protein [Rhodopirellula baltica]
MSLRFIRSAAQQAATFGGQPKRWLRWGLVIIVAAQAGCDRGKSDPLPSDTSNAAVKLQASTASDLASDPAPITPASREETIALAERAAHDGDLVTAETELKRLLVRDPDDAEIVFRLAAFYADQNKLSLAIDMLSKIPSGHPDAGLPALGQAADWCMQVGRYDDAEQRYRAILDVVPSAAEAHRKLAFLYNCQGRRHEAASHLQQLCRQGNIRQDELHALIHLSHAMTDETETVEEIQYKPLGVSAKARSLFTDEQYEEAFECLQESIQEDTQPASIEALFGRAAAEAQDMTQLEKWLSNVDPEVQQYAEYWAAIGLWLVTQNRHQEAARALLEAIDRDPTDYRSISRLRSVMETLGDEDAANRWDTRAVTLRSLFLANNRVADMAAPDPETIEKLAAILDQLDRSLEAVLWRSIAAYHQQAPRETMLKLQQTMRTLVKAEHGFPERQTRLCGVKIGRFPLPSIEQQQLRESIAEDAITSTQSEQERFPAAFRNVANEIGLQHSYQVASRPLDHGFSIYQSFGGSVTVTDFDLDGQADLYFSQGGADPPTFIGSQTNQLFRHQGDQVVDVTLSAQVDEYRYSMGTTAGDWNQDGFADLFIANIGTNTLLLNNGDGTFTQQPIDYRDDQTLLTTSLAVADLNGDMLPDLFELNYVHDERLTDEPKRNERGEVLEPLMPQYYQAAFDRIIFQSADGGIEFHQMDPDPDAARAGLGVIVSDFDNEPGNEVFVGNDVYANQWWQRDHDGNWHDLAMLRGCAYGFSGAKTASMGIASGDFDRNGWLDFHITNFQREHVSYFLNQSGQYQDRNVQFGLAKASLSVLGFGTQSIDYDNDSDLDLVVTNGHIEDAIANRAPFEQPSQLFSNEGSSFELVDVTDPSGYWAKNHLGRGLAKLDWNQDGKLDYVLTHLNEDSALLVNESPNENHWIEVELRGTKCERDAIGARVKIQFNGREMYEWVTAGDGYLCHNEDIVSFGLGTANKISELTVIWPSGSTQTINDVDADQRILIIEDQPESFRR